mgnify:CR=1 FL=1
MLRLFSRRLAAALALGLFLPNAAFSSTLHACCMEMSGAHHASTVAADAHGGMAMHAAADRESHGGMAMHDAADQGAHREVAHDGHASHGDSARHAPAGHGAHDDAHGSHASGAEDSDPSGVCCCLVCDCAASNAGLVSPVTTHSLETAATVAAASAPYVAVLTSPVSHLRPYPTGPPSTTV